VAEYKERVNLKDSEIARLQREKSTLNIKEIGENLENWCNDEFKKYAVSGFENCTFEKITQNIKGEKADYLFTLFVDETMKTPVVKVVCEMKSESLVGDNKKKNIDHVDKLDRDRNNIGGEAAYALLISELEKDNDSVIEKIQGKDKMFVVRPAYFIPFLSIIYNLGTKYKQIVLEELEFEDKKKILEEFEAMKNEILENSIKNIKSTAEEIRDKVGKIKKLCQDIEDEHINKLFKHLRTIENKISDFNIKKITKKIDGSDDKKIDINKLTINDIIDSH
jgi:hypothetical protein